MKETNYKVFAKQIHTITCASMLEETECVHIKCMSRICVVLSVRVIFQQTTCQEAGRLLQILSTFCLQNSVPIFQGCLIFFKSTRFEIKNELNESFENSVYPQQRKTYPVQSFTRKPKLNQKITRSYLYRKKAQGTQKLFLINSEVY